MTTTEADLKLRLAARTLVEWNTPTTAPEYQRVLTDLLKVHPYAASWGLTPDKELLKLDERGTVLWYLSETMNAKEAKPLEDKFTEYEEFLEERGVDGLINYGVVGNTNETLWTAGPTKTEAADAIFSAVKSEEPIGYESLLTITVPLEPELQEESLRQLVEFKGIRSGIIQSLSRLVRRLYRILLGVQGFVVAGSTILTLMIGVATAVFGRDAGDGVSSVWWAVLGVVLSLASSAFTVFYKERIEKSIRGVVASFSERAEELPRELHRLNLGSRFFTFIGFICSTNARVLVSLLRTRPQHRWVDIALTATKNATPDVIRQILNLVRDPEVDESMRDKMFQWLCKVNVTRV